MLWNHNAQNRDKDGTKPTMNIPSKEVQPKAKWCKHVSSKENEPEDEFPGINENSDEGIDFASEKALKGEKWDMDESNKYEW